MAHARSAHRARTPRAATLTVVLLLAVATAGCDRGGQSPAGDDDGDLPIRVAEADGELDRSRDMPARVTVDVRGDTTFAWQGEHTITLTRVGQPHLSVNLLSLGFIDYLPVPDQPTRHFRWAFDLLKAYRDTPNTFTLTNDALTAQGFKDLAFLIVLHTRDSAAGRQPTQDDITTADEYNQLTQPCTLVVGEGETTGSLTCPQLTIKDTNRHIALTVTWQQNGPATSTAD